MRLRRLDPTVASDAVAAVIDGRPEDEVRRALAAVVRERPDDVFGFFRACLRRVIRTTATAPPPGVRPLARPDDDPFAPY